VNLVFEFGQVSPKEAQDLARHSTPDLTFNVYGRSGMAEEKKAGQWPMAWNWGPQPRMYDPFDAVFPCVEERL